jgi:hypothetical protein
MSAFLDLVASIVAVLSTGPALAGGFIVPGRAVPLPAEQTQGIFVYLARATGDMPFAGSSRADWDTDIGVTCMARAAPGADAYTAVDPLLTAAYARLTAAAPPADSDGWTLQPTINWDVDEFDTTLGSAELRIRVRHRTGEGSLAADT